MLFMTSDKKVHETMEAAQQHEALLEKLDAIKDDVRNWVAGESGATGKNIPYVTNMIVAWETARERVLTPPTED